MINQDYGVVYTPDTLASFVSSLLFQIAQEDKCSVNTILDPASGECALLKSAKSYFTDGCSFIGIDVDIRAVEQTQNEYLIFHDDTIVPTRAAAKSDEYWKETLPTIDMIIANPPWSSDRIYSKEVLKRAGYSLALGQFDSYVLFIELAYSVLREDGLMAFILPDSLFDTQNTDLRKFLATKTEIKVIARLGEKIFKEVNRATTVIICKKTIPTQKSKTACFRLSTEARKAYLANSKTLSECYEEDMHIVDQARFWRDSDYRFDIDTRSEEETLIEKIAHNAVAWDSLFSFSRGVEISKHGGVLVCPSCKKAQGFNVARNQSANKTCSHCGCVIPVTDKNFKHIVFKDKVEKSRTILVGEGVYRYRTQKSLYIIEGIPGIDYKDYRIYESPKILIRKTGLGIYGAIDYDGSMTSQTVYMLTYRNDNETAPLEYYLALINSRVVYYYYLKKYGENEWKSHPYLTKHILFSLPLREYSGDSLDLRITELSQALIDEYDYGKDLALEELIMEKYGLSAEEKSTIIKEMNRLPNLSAINNMKVEIQENV